MGQISRPRAKTSLNALRDHL